MGLVIGAVVTFKPTTSWQVGYPGVGMQLVATTKDLPEKVAANQLPLTLPPVSDEGIRAVNAYKNVQVLGHVSAANFTRTMTAMTIWVSPAQGCGYCHAPKRDASGKPVLNEDGYPEADLANMQSDELYTKRVARRMLQMTLHLNGDWKQHVAATGVTCWTCHRGNPVPKNIWFDTPEAESSAKLIGGKGNQNAPNVQANLSSLPNDALRTFLVGDANIRVQSSTALPDGNRRSVKQTEWTYSLMTHMSNALGVNCTYCHNSRQWSDWSQSPATRATAWYGIRMVRDLNNAYLEPLKPQYPENRLGALGDAPKVNCTTCHQGAYKPLLGVSMLKDYPVLAEAKPQPPKTFDAATDAAAKAGAAVLAAAADGGAADLMAVATGDAGIAAIAGDAGATVKAAQPAADAGAAKAR
jgi:photosynthetic reaction center cytochrome c subunit